MNIRITGMEIKHPFDPWIVVYAEDVSPTSSQKYVFPVEEKDLLEIDWNTVPPTARFKIEVDDIVDFPSLGTGRPIPPL